MSFSFPLPKYFFLKGKHRECRREGEGHTRLVSSKELWAVLG